MVLNMREIEVDVAENGRIAVEMYESHPAGYYDAILMDMRMPEMDGLEATRTIRAMDREDAKTIPIIALTANAFDEDVQRSMQAGLNAHLSKPVEPEDLFDRSADQAVMQHSILFHLCAYRSRNRFLFSASVLHASPLPLCRHP